MYAIDGKTAYPHLVLSQVLMETDENGQAQAHYVYGLGLIGREDASGTYQTYHYDRRGSTVALTESTGEVTDAYAYGPYGEALAHAGTTEQPFQYNGRDGVMTDANGLYHMRARYYNPDIKRFINRDVVRGMLDAAQTLNRYAYVNGNPISYIDPFGLSRDGDSIWLQGGSFLLDSVPYVGTLKGFQQAFSGVNHVTGSKLSTSERWSEGVGSALSLVPIPGLKHVGTYGTNGAVSLWRKLDLQFFAGKGAGKSVQSNDVVPYRPSNSPLENHHGVMDIWAKHNVPEYVSRGAKTPTVALTKEQHNATKAVYRQWLYEKTGKKVGGKVDWQSVSPKEIQKLTETMFDAAKVPNSTRQEYYNAFNRYNYRE